MNSGNSIVLSLLVRFGIYLLAVVVAYLLATVAATQFVVASLRSMGIDVGLGNRMGMTVQDIAGMAPMFLPMVAFGMLCAFLTAALLCHWWSRWRMTLYLLAGAVALVTIHLTLNLAFGVTPVAVARTSGGMASQALAGAAGAFCYIRLHERLGAAGN